ncbi:MAG TPA: superoxide dismutase family protein [Nocardioides sp.]|nr:superoxide dismutase family protein [Nocardioides sp.]
MRTSHASRTLAIAALTGGVVLFAASPSLAGADSVRSEGTMVRMTSTDLLPQGATARVHAVYNAAGDTFVTLHLRGMKPDHTYGAHAHVGECGLGGQSAGPHFQRQRPPQGTPATDPSYANPANEIWLDVTTNAAGNGASQARQTWQFAPGTAPRSVIIHERRTAIGGQDGDAGTAGARLACVDVSF